MDAPVTHPYDSTYHVLAARSLDSLWVGIIRTATYGWIVPEGVIRDSLRPGGRACMPATCQDGLFRHWVECADGQDGQAAGEGGRPADLCRQRRGCPLYQDGEACRGTVTVAQPSLAGMGAWLVWSLVLQVHRDLGGALKVTNPAIRRGLPHTFQIPRYWQLSDPISLAAEVVRRQIACEGLLEFAAPVISDDNRSITLRARPTKAFFAALEEARSSAATDAPAQSEDSEGSSVVRLARALIAYGRARRAREAATGSGIPERTLVSILVMAIVFVVILIALELRA